MTMTETQDNTMNIPAMPSVYDDITDILRILVINSWIIALMAIAGLAGSYFLTQSQTPIYQSTSTVVLTPEVAPAQLAQTLNNFDTLLGTYVYMLGSEGIRGPVRDRLLEDYPANVVNNAVVDVVPVQNSTVISVRVRSEDPEFAQAMANGLVEELLTSNPVPNLNNVMSIRQFDEARVGQNPVQPILRNNLVLGGVGSMAVGVVLAFLFHSVWTYFKGRDE